MHKLTWGYRREKQNTSAKITEEKVSQKSERTNVEKLLSTAGLFAVALMLAVPVFKEEKARDADTAVAVMGTAVGESASVGADGDREVLSLPEKHTSVELGEKSFYDYLGEFFRDLIYG